MPTWYRMLKPNKFYVSHTQANEGLFIFRAMEINFLLKIFETRDWCWVRQPFLWQSYIFGIFHYWASWTISWIPLSHKFTIASHRLESGNHQPVWQGQPCKASPNAFSRKWRKQDFSTKFEFEPHLVSDLQLWVLGLLIWLQQSSMLEPLRELSFVWRKHQAASLVPVLRCAEKPRQWNW